MKAITADPSRRLEIFARKDASFDKVFTCVNASDQSAADLTGWTYRLDILDSFLKEPKLSLTMGSGITVTDNQIAITMTPAQLDFKKEDNFYFFWGFYGGKTYLWLNGRFVLNNKLFDGVDNTDTLTISFDTEDTVIELSISGGSSSGDEHFLGKYISLAALETAHATADDGDYAIVDPGSGTEALQYIWDEEEGWVSTGPAPVVDWDDVQNKPATFPPSSHDHNSLYYTKSEVNNLLVNGNFFILDDHFMMDEIDSNLLISNFWKGEFEGNGALEGYGIGNARVDLFNYLTGLAAYEVGDLARLRLKGLFTPVNRYCTIDVHFYHSPPIEGTDYLESCVGIFSSNVGVSEDGVFVYVDDQNNLHAVLRSGFVNSDIVAIENLTEGYHKITFRKELVSTTYQSSIYVDDVIKHATTDLAVGAPNQIFGGIVAAQARREYGGFAPFIIERIRIISEY